MRALCRQGILWPLHHQVLLIQEIVELRKQIEHHPEVARYAYESIRLREKLKKYEGMASFLEEKDATLEAHVKYERLLAARILELEDKKPDPLPASTFAETEGDACEAEVRRFAVWL